MNDISDNTRRDIANLLTIGRTIMANDRTLLAFLRTSLAFCAAGIGLIKYLDPTVFDVIGWLFVVLAGVFLIWGVYRHRHVNKILREVTPEEQQATEKEMGL